MVDSRFIRHWKPVINVEIGFIVSSNDETETIFEILIFSQPV